MMRYLPLTPDDRTTMLATIGATSVDDLFVDVPEAARLDGPISDLPDHASELAVERHLNEEVPLLCRGHLPGEVALYDMFPFGACHSSFSLLLSSAWRSP